MLMALQTIGDHKSSYTATYQETFILTSVLLTHLHMNSLNIIVDFSTHMYFRKLTDSGTVWTFSAATFHEVIWV